MTNFAIPLHYIEVLRLFVELKMQKKRLTIYMIKGTNVHRYKEEEHAMTKKSWYGRPMAMYGIHDLGRHDKPTGPKFAVGVVGVMPFDFISMDAEIGGFEIIRNFREDEDAATEQYMYREEDVDWARAARNGEPTVRLARSLVQTPGLRWLHMRPWGLMAYGWPEMKPYFPEMLERMQTALTEVCGDREFVDEAHRMQFPTTSQVEASSRFGINLPL